MPGPVLLISQTQAGRLASHSQSFLLAVNLWAGSRIERVRDRPPGRHSARLIAHKHQLQEPNYPLNLQPLGLTGLLQSSSCCLALKTCHIKFNTMQKFIQKANTKEVGENFILGSGSPRRSELLAEVLTDFQVVVSDAEEMSSHPDGPIPLVRGMPP